MRKYAYCFHSEEFQKHHSCVPYPLHFLVTYEFIGPDITEDKIKELEEIANKEIDREVIDRANFVEGITENLKTAYKLVASSVKIPNSGGRLFIKNEQLSAINNIITGACNWRLRSMQMQYEEGDMSRWRMDVRIIKYHLMVINDMFNQEQIGGIESRKYFMQIYPFQVCNELVLNVLFLGSKIKMEHNHIKNITSNFIYELGIEETFRSIIEELVRQHWPRRGIILRYLWNIVPGSRIVFENKNYYVVQWHEERCRMLMDKVANTTLLQEQRRLRDSLTNEGVLEMKVWK